MFIAFFIYLSTILTTLFANFTEHFYHGISIDDGNLKINDYHSIASCVVEICAKELFWNPTVIINIGRNYSDREAHFIHELHKELTAQNVTYVTTTDGVHNRAFVDASYLIVTYFEDCDSMTKFDFNALKLGNKYLNVIEDYIVDVCIRNFRDIGNVIGEYDVSFLVNEKNLYNLYTFIPYFNHTTCKQEVRRPTLINTCSNGKFLQKETYPIKNPTDLKKCPFKVGMGSLFPFAMIENKSSLQSYDPLDGSRVRGMDYEIIKIMTEKFNATLELHYVYKHEENPYVNIEFLQLVLNGSLDACAGGLYRIFGTAVQYSGVYARQSVMWIYTADRVTRTWNNMVTDIDGLYLFIVFYFCYSLTWYLIRRYDKYVVSMGNILLNSWGALVGTASLQEPTTLKQKILNLVYLNMCLHLSVYISIQLFSFFTVLDAPELLKTNEDVMNSGRTAYLTSLTKYFTKDESYERFANTSVECTGFSDCGKVVLEKKGVTVYIQGYFFNLQAATAVNDEARILRSVENLLTVYYEMLIRTESPLVFKFQKIVVRLFEAGITEKLFEEAIGLTVVGKAKIAAKNIMSSSHSCQEGCTLSLHQFSGVFYGWEIGCVLSCALCMGEIIWKRNARLIKVF